MFFSKKRRSGFSENPGLVVLVRKHRARIRRTARFMFAGKPGFLGSVISNNGTKDIAKKMKAVTALNVKGITPTTQRSIPCM
jgi:hypothetical protein